MKALAGMACLGVLLLAGEVGAQDAEVSAGFDSSPSVGVEIGNPTGVVAKLPVGQLVGVGVGVGSGTADGSGFLGHADVLITPVVLGQGAIGLAPHLGVGVRYYSHQYEPASVDEIPDRHLGVRFPVGLGLRLRSLSMEAFAEAAPGWDLKKSESCTLMSGTRSVCPHEDDRFFLHLALGARYVF